MKNYTLFLFLFAVGLTNVHAQSKYTAEHSDSVITANLRFIKLQSDCLLFIQTIENVSYKIVGVYPNNHDAGTTTIETKMEYKDFPLALTKDNKKSLIVKANGQIELYFKLDYIGEDGVLIKSNTHIGNQFVTDLEYTDNVKIVLGISTPSRN